MTDSVHSDSDWEGCPHGVMEGWCYQRRPAGPPVLTAEQEADITEAVRAYWQRWGKSF